MRVRPFFWVFLATVCASVVLFAALISISKPTPMRAHIDQISTTTTQATSLRLLLTDSEGIPIDQAAVSPHAYMLTMHMEPQQVSVKPLGKGVYLAQIRFSMPGTWNIDIAARADGFNAVQQSIQLDVL